MFKCGKVSGNFYFKIGPGPEPPDHILPITLLWTGLIHKEVKISIDLVPAISFEIWKHDLMREAKALLTRQVMKEECLAIAKSTSPLVQERNMYFLLSFSHLEAKIICSLPHDVKRDICC